MRIRIFCPDPRKTRVRFTKDFLNFMFMDFASSTISIFPWTWESASRFLSWNWKVGPLVISTYSAKIEHPVLNLFHQQLASFFLQWECGKFLWLKLNPKNENRLVNWDDTGCPLIHWFTFIYLTILCLFNIFIYS